MSDSHTHDHPIAGYTFLLLVAVGLAFGAKAAIQHSGEAAEQKRLAEIEAKKQRIREAVAIGQAGDYARAETALEALLHEEPENNDILFNLGIAKAALEKEDEADKIFEKVLEHDPSDWDAVAERAGIAHRKKADDQAIALLEKIPVDKGHLKERLMRDPLWADLMSDPRMIELAKKHGVPVEVHDTTVRDVGGEPGAEPAKDGANNGANGGAKEGEKPADAPKPPTPPVH